MPTGVGWVRTREYREKLSIASKLVGKGKWMKGRKHSEETKRKMSLARKGKPNLSVSGEKHYCWKGGITLGENFKEYAKLACLKRIARKKMAEGSFTLVEWQLLKKRYGNICPSCGRKEPEIKLTPDHITPLIRGGSDWIKNIQPLCLNCNCKKNRKIIKYQNPIVES